MTISPHFQTLGQQPPAAIGRLAWSEGVGINAAALGRRFGTSARLATLVTLLLTPTLGTGCVATAEDDHLGIVEFEIACMSCHGIEGRGDGSQANSLKRRPADLTQIAKSNGGIFPSKKVAEIIDGRASVAAHGARDMPVWGDRYRVVTEAGESAAEVEKRARAQISALVEYLETIQEK
jgi:mono/diheme cytochrome c family protein